MAKKSLIAKTKRRNEKAARARKDGRVVKFPARLYNRCRICGRNRGYLRMFDMCRICFREHASRGEMVGVRKASW